MYETMGRVWESAKAGNFITMDQKADLQLAGTYAVRAACDAIELLATSAGGNAIRQSERFNRHLRDLRTLMEHAYLSADPYEDVEPSLSVSRPVGASSTLSWARPRLRLLQRRAPEMRRRPYSRRSLMRYCTRLPVLLAALPRFDVEPAQATRNDVILPSTISRKVVSKSLPRLRSTDEDSRRIEGTTQRPEVVVSRTFIARSHTPSTNYHNRLKRVRLPPFSATPHQHLIDQ